MISEEDIKLSKFVVTVKAEFFDEGKDDGIEVEYDNIYPEPYVFHEKDHLFYVLGSPIIGEKINRKKVCEVVRTNGLDNNILSLINGEFLIIWFNRVLREINLINDRFTSIPFYFFTREKYFFGSVYYKDVWKQLDPLTNKKVLKEAFFEFIWLQRLMGEKTYDTKSKFLWSASCLTFNGRKIHTKNYWFPDFTKDYKSSIRTQAIILAKRLKKSINRKTSDNKRYGLFLSGGRDTRVVLAAFEKPLICFTVGSSRDNNEYLVALEASKVKGAEHVFLPSPPDHYSKILDKAVLLGGGMYTFPHALFLPYRNFVIPKVDVVFHGHGLDYFFQGMYLPRKYFYIFRRRTYCAKLRRLSGDFISDYLTNIHHRLKDIDIMRYIKLSHREKMMEFLRYSVDEVVQRGREFCNTLYDLWEYMLIHNLSRHYTNPNLSSIATYVEQRTIAFDNDVFSLYMSLPEKYRLGANISCKTLRYLDPKLGKIRTGNTNIRADYSPLMQTATMIGSWLLRKSKISKKEYLHPHPEDRTWPDNDVALRNQRYLVETAMQVAKSEVLETLSFLDMTTIRKDIDEWLKSPTGGAAFIFTLITIDRFLRATK